jgi:hypothetical protein
LLGIAMLKLSLFKPWLGWLGIVSALLIMFGSAEGAGLEIAADVNVVGFLLWSVWMIGMAVFLIWAKPKASWQTQAGSLQVAVNAG